MSAIGKVSTISPFDAIRRVDENGSEYWFARELMSTLGYRKWERFVDSIDRAKIACSNTGSSVDNHFADAGLYTRGIPSEYKLSRYACYLTAMNGDPRKPEIASAQAYFAIKTHEAETSISQIQVPSLTSAQLLVAMAQQLADQEQKLLQQERQQKELTARLESVEHEQGRYIAPGGSKYTVLGFAIKNGIEISANVAAAKGRNASSICRKQNIDIERIYDPRFGYVGLYPESVLIEVFK